MKYKDFCQLKSNDPMENIFPKGTSAEEGIVILKNHFLGENWYSTLPMNCKDQIITEIVGDILLKYPEPEKMKKRNLFSLFN